MTMPGGSGTVIKLSQKESCLVTTLGLPQSVIHLNMLLLRAGFLYKPVSSKRFQATTESRYQQRLVERHSC